MMFLDCPAYLDQEGAVRCGLPAEVICRFTMHSADGPVESAMIKCPVGHYFNGAIESLTSDSAAKRAPGPVGAGRDSLPGAPERKARRPNSAPTYYLGHPAGLWITVMRPRRRASASRHPLQAVTGGQQTPSPHGRPDTGAGAACAMPAAMAWPAIAAQIR